MKHGLHRSTPIYCLEKKWEIESEKHEKTNEIFDAEIEEKYKKLDTFNNAIAPILFVSQFFAMVPLTGVMNSNPRHVKFSYKTFGILNVVIFMLSGGWFTLMLYLRLMENGITGRNIVGLIFFTCGLTTCMLFFFLAKQWPRLILKWTEVEMIFLSPPYLPMNYTLKGRIRSSAMIIGILALVEHLMFWSSTNYNYLMKSRLCSDFTNDTSFDDFIERQFDNIFIRIPYNKFAAIFILFINFTFTFIWNYMDLFIMLISLGLAIRFEQINQRIQSFPLQSITEDIWSNIRSDYVKACELVDYVDERLSLIVLLSCVNNLYFICFQFLNIFKKLRYTINYIYFWYSLTYLTGRTIIVFLCASKVNDESKEPLKALRKMPSFNYNEEVERFIIEITGQVIALSGKKFYFLTRKLLFAMAGTIVTYELVLLQFDDKNHETKLSALCD